MSDRQTPSAILFVDQYSSVGGGQILLLEMLSFALARGHRTALIAPPGGELQAQVKMRFGSQVQWVDCAPPRMRPSRKGISDLLTLFASLWEWRRHRSLLQEFDCIHVNGPRLALPVTLFAGMRARVLVHLHLNHQRAEKLLLWMLSFFPAFRLAIAVSEFVYLRLPTRLRRKTILVRNWLPRATEISLAFSPRDLNHLPTAVVVGRLSPEKGQLWVVQAARQLPQWRFLFIGSSTQGQESYETQLRAQATSNCIFLGESRTPWALAQEKGAQVALVPSQWEEPFGLVALEAYAHGFMTAVCLRGNLRALAEEYGLPTFESPAGLITVLEKTPVWPERSKREALLQSPQKAAQELGLLWGEIL